MKLNSKFPREILLEIKYRGEYSLDNVTIYYVNRGSPDNLASKKGADISELGHYYIEFYDLPQSAYIPYHRIRKITYNEEVIFRR